MEHQEIAMSAAHSLTPRQREIYEFIKTCIDVRGYGPTVREIGERFGIRSPNGVIGHLKALERKGLISRTPRLSRAIQLMEQSKQQQRETPSPRTRGREFKIIIEKHPDGYVAYPLGFRGTVLGEGNTYEEALEDVKAAIEFHIEAFGGDVYEHDSPVLEVFLAEARVRVP